MDGDGIPYRTLPGVHPKGAYFTRGSGHNKHAGYTEDDVEYTEVVDRIDRKVQRAARSVPAPIVQQGAGATKIGLVTVGGCHAACIEALDQLAKDGVARRLHARARVPVRRRRAASSSSRTTTNFVVEQNRDGQLRNLLTLETGVPDGAAGVGALLRRVPAERQPRDRRRQGQAGEGSVGTGTP